MAHPTKNDDELKNDMIKGLLKNISKLRQQYDSMYEDAPDLFRTINTKGIILNCNKSYARTLGYSKNEIIGTSILDHAAESGLDALQKSFEDWKKEGRVHNKEIWMKRKDGTTFPTLLSASGIYDENGALIGSNTVIRNISEIYYAKKEIEDQKIKRLATIGELSSRIAHDMNNPLSVIKNTINIMKLQNPNLDEKTISNLARINRAVLRMSHQIDEVLDYVRPKPLQLDNNSMSEILDSTMDKLVIPDKVRVTLPQKDATVICDAEKMEVVFANLITNAIQAMNNEGNIDITISELTDHVVIEVADTGPGIPDDVLPKIFDPLFTTRQIGTGLGLVSCKSIVEKHEGTIEVKTEVGKGTTFIIRLPKFTPKSEQSG